MANGAPTQRRPGALGRRQAAQATTTPKGEPQGFDADARTEERENRPVVVGKRSFTRYKKDWKVSRWMRKLLREQESALAKSSRIQRRVAELETEQTEAAATGDTAREEELETTIGALLEAADDAIEDGELVSYRLLALLLKPAEPTGDEEALEGFGPEHVEELDEWAKAVEFLQPALDVEDAAAMARELTGSSEPDPPTTPSSGTGSTS